MNPSSGQHLKDTAHLHRRAHARRRTAAGLAAVAALASLTLTACGDDSDTGSAEATTPSSSDGSPPPTPPLGVRLNVGDWTSDDPAGADTATGQVAISDTGCLYLHVGPGSSNKAANFVDLLWPDGTSLQQVGSGPIEVWNGDNEPIARIGTRVDLTGATLKSQGASDLTCHASEQPAFEITEELPALPVE